MAKYDSSSSDISALFKRVYGKISEATFNTMYPFFSQVKKVDGHGGDDFRFPIPLGFGGSVGSGSLPTANRANWDIAVVTTKKVYGRLEIDRKTIYDAQKSEQAFVRGTKEYVRKVVESYTRHSCRILFGNSDGALGTLSAVSGSGPYVCTISDATWKEANFEENDYVNFASNTDLFEITVVDAANKQITVARVTGSYPIGSTDVMYVQGSKDNDPTGLKEVCDATSGSLYGITVQRHWQSYQKAAGSVGISPDLLNEAVTEMMVRTGRGPSHILMSPLQYRRFKDQLEDQKRYPIKPADKRFKGLASFSGLEFICDNGSIPILMERFVENDRVYLLNTAFIEMRRQAGFGWFDDDGTVLLRSATEDAYEARYGGYWEFYINPREQGVITGLSTS